MNSIKQLCSTLPDSRDHDYINNIMYITSLGLHETILPVAAIYFDVSDPFHLFAAQHS